MKKLHRASKYAKYYEQYCQEYFPDKVKEICSNAEKFYQDFLKQMSDLGGRENPMEANMEDWFTILSFYEATHHKADGQVLLAIGCKMAEDMHWLGKFINGNKSKWVYKAFEKFYDRYMKQLNEHRAKGEWSDSWSVEINPNGHTEGFSFNLIGCPIARHAKEYGYEQLLPYLCRTDHMLAEVLHTRLIRTKTEALGGDCCDYWYVGDKSPVLKQYEELKKI